MAMLNKTENQSSGDECINNQAGRDINYNFYKGISSEKCREICNNLFQENFIKLHQEAADIAFVRANNLIDLFLDKLYSKLYILCITVIVANNYNNSSIKLLLQRS